MLGLLKRRSLTMEENERTSRAALSGGVPSHYANEVQVVATMQDVRFSFGRASPSGEPATLDVHIYMAYPAVKLLHRLLGQMIANYEAQFGEIPTEPKPAQ
jgi:uncharacterized protein DUF3467